MTATRTKKRAALAQPAQGASSRFVVFGIFGLVVGALALGMVWLNSRPSKRELEIQAEIRRLEEEGKRREERLYSAEQRDSIERGVAETQKRWDAEKR